ncbi:MAG: hypothetical protein GY819_19365 [Planctomycetaceae bacterium]|nr:hypothetical protein [Planctomycetaceae bacterium]
MKLASSLSQQVQRKPNVRMTAEHGCLAIKLFRPLSNVLAKKALLGTVGCTSIIGLLESPPAPQ